MASWGKPAAQQNLDGSAAYGLLNDFMDHKHMSLRARQELQQSMRAGSAQWVDTLSRGRATQRRQPAKSAVAVPRPATKPGVLSLGPANVARRPHSQILAECDHYAREQFGGAPAHDAAAQRKQDQMLFEFGRRRLEEMQAQAAEQQRMKRAPLQQPTATEIREGMIKQIFAEIEERATFLDSLQGAKVHGDTVDGVKLEIVNRLNELEAYGIATDRQQRLPAKTESPVVPLQ